MSAHPQLNQANLLHESLRRLGEENSVLSQAARVLEKVSVTTGLGEVLCDYAAQAHTQLHEIMVAARETAGGAPGPEYAEVLQQAHFVIKTTRTVLDMTPVAMQRNKADAIGETQKLSRPEVAQIAHNFKQSADIALLLDMENTGLPSDVLQDVGAAQPMMGTQGSIETGQGTLRH